MDSESVPQNGNGFDENSTCDEGLAAVNDEGLAPIENTEAGAIPPTEPMELDESLSSSLPGRDEPSSYIGDNCLDSTPANTETNSPQMDTEPDSETGRDEESNIIDRLDAEEPSPTEESPDQSVSSASAVIPVSDEHGEAVPSNVELPLVSDVASSDDIAGGDVSSAAETALTPAISSSTTDAVEEGTAAISSSESEALAASSTNGPTAALDLPLPSNTVSATHRITLNTVDGYPDTSASANIEEPTFQLPTTQYDTYSRVHAFVSSTNANVGLLQQQVSSTCGDVGSALTDESAVSSSISSNGAASHDAADALATLASAAIHRQHSTNEIKSELDESISNQEFKQEKDEEPWYTVAIVKGTSFTVQNYIADPNIDLSKLTIDNLPDLSSYPTIPLDPGTGYKFRVAAINSCGRGEFGEESAFKTCVPGYPGAPSDIKISKSAEGANMSWEPPQASPDGIFEYSVYLAVKPLNPNKDPPLKTQLTFIRVYCGKSTTCIVPQSSLSNAHVDSSSKPAIIFRIAARNDKGYGPATQVRWLQENKATGVKRLLDGRPPGTPPTKQHKPAALH